MKLARLLRRRGWQRREGRLTGWTPHTPPPSPSLPPAPVPHFLLPSPPPLPSSAALGSSLTPVQAAEPTPSNRPLDLRAPPRENRWRDVSFRCPLCVFFSSLHFVSTFFFGKELLNNGYVRIGNWRSLSAVVGAFYLAGRELLSCGGSPYAFGASIVFQQVGNPLRGVSRHTWEGTPPPPWIGRRGPGPSRFLLFLHPIQIRLKVALLMRVGYFCTKPSSVNDIFFAFCHVWWGVWGGGTSPPWPTPTYPT